MIDASFRLHAPRSLCLAATAALLLSACSGTPGKGEAAPCKIDCQTQGGAGTEREKTYLIPCN